MALEKRLPPEKKILVSNDQEGQNRSHTHKNHGHGMPWYAPSPNHPRQLSGKELVRPRKDSMYGTSTSTCNISSPWSLTLLHNSTNPKRYIT